MIWAEGKIVGYKSKMLYAVMLFCLMHLMESTLHHSSSADGLGSKDLPDQTQFTDSHGHKDCLVISAQ